MPRFFSLRFSGMCFAWSVAALFFTGAWGYSRQNNLTALPQNNVRTLLYGKVERVTPTKSGRFMRLNTRLLAFRQGEEGMQCNINIFIYIPIERYDSCLRAGSKICAHARIGPMQQKSFQIPGSNSFPPSVFISRYDSFRFAPVRTSFPARLNAGLLSRLKAAIRDPDSFALLAGLSLGNKEAFDPELKKAYADTGAAHILAVSGLHIGIVYAVLLSISNLFFRGNNRLQHIIKQIIVLGALALFAALVEFTPSVTRALLMVALSMAGRIVRRPIPSMQTLFTAALIITVLNPAALFEVSFQLSFCAVLAILTLQPPLQRLWQPKTIAGRYVWSLITVSTAAQMGTVLLAYHYFGTIPYLFMLTNLIVIPLTVLLLYLLCAWLALGAIPGVGTALLWAMEQLARLMNQGVIFIDKLI